MVFVIAGMGCGTGTGAVPVIARAAKEAGALTVGVVGKPVAFEGKKRLLRAEGGMRTFLDVGDSLIVIPNDKLVQLVPKKAAFRDVLRKSDEALYHAVRGLSAMVTQQDLIAFDFADMKSVLAGSSMAVMAIGTASGEHRARTAVMRALNCPLLGDTPIGDLRGILLSITSSKDITIDEIQEVGVIIHEAAHEDTHIFYTVHFDDSMGDEMRVTLIGTLSAYTWEPVVEDCETRDLPSYIKKPWWEWESSPGNRLRVLRTREKITQKELAKVLGIRQRHVSAMEKGLRVISEEMAKCIGEKYDVPYIVFL